MLYLLKLWKLVWITVLLAPAVCMPFHMHFVNCHLHCMGFPYLNILRPSEKVKFCRELQANILYIA